MKIRDLMLGMLLFLTSCKKHEEEVIQQETTTTPISLTHTVKRIEQIKLTDDALCADVILTIICDGKSCDRYVNLVESPCEDTIKIQDLENENLKPKMVK